MKIPNARALSRLGPRGTLGLALQALAEEDDRAVALTADLAITAGLERFRQSYPDRFFNVGIAEQNLVGVASGLAEGGWTPFAVTFANFAALRANEMVRHHLGYMQQNVKLVGIGAGFAMGQFGTTHYSVEDVGALRSIPNLAIVAPADCSEVVDAVFTVARMEGPVYLRLNGVPSMPSVEQQSSSFEIGKARELRRGEDIILLAAGSMVARSLDAATILSGQGLDVGVLNMHTIKPLDNESVRAAAGNAGVLATVEEHSVVGGLGSAVLECLADCADRPPLLRVGVNDTYPKVGNYDWVLEYCGLTAEAIAETVSKFHAQWTL